MLKQMLKSFVPGPFFFAMRKGQRRAALRVSHVQYKREEIWSSTMTNSDQLIHILKNWIDRNGIGGFHVM